MKDINPNFLICYLDISQIYAQNQGKLSEEKVLLELLNTMNQTLKSIEEDNTKKIYHNIKKLYDSVKLKKSVSESWRFFYVKKIGKKIIPT